MTQKTDTHNTNWHKTQHKWHTHDTKNTIFDTKQHNTDTTKTHENPPISKRRPHINFHHFVSKKCQNTTPQKITILSSVYIKEYQCTNMYIKKNNIYMNYIFIISSINTHTPIYKKIIYNYSYKMLIKKNKNSQPHTPQGGYGRSNPPIIKKTTIHNHPKKHTNHTSTKPSGFILS